MSTIIIIVFGYKTFNELFFFGTNYSLLSSDGQSSGLCSIKVRL